MKVLHLVKTSTGALWALRQMRELVKLGVEVCVAMPTDGPLVEQYRQAGITIFPMVYSLTHICKTGRELRNIVKEINPDIIHSHFVLTTYIMRLVLRNDKHPRIFQVPGPLHLENRLFRTIDVLLAQKNDFWMGSCKWTNWRYEKSGVKKSSLFLSYYGTDIQKNNDYEKGALKEMLGLKESDILVGIVAYMYAPKRFLGQRRGLKGHEDLIDAIALLKDKYPHLYCVCIGGAWDGAVAYENRVKAYAKAKTDGRVLFTGTITNVSKYYNDLFCVIHPSHSENLGGAGESLLLGVPTIATNIGGFPDIVIDKVTGILVKPKSPKSIAIAIEELLTGKQNIPQMIEQGMAHTAEMLDVKNSSKSVLSAYRILHNKEW